MRYAIILALLLVHGCTHGPSIKSLPFVTAPIGSMAKFSVSQLKMQGELVAVQDTGYVIINLSDRVVFAPFASVRNMRIPTLNRAVSGYPSESDRRALRLASRYPQGLSNEILRALLARRSQLIVERLQ